MATQNKKELVLVRTFNAPIESIWDFWTNPKKFAKWYGSPGKLINVKIDLKIGGEWQATTVLSDGTSYPAVAVFKKIQKPTKLIFNYLNIEDRKDKNIEVMTVILKDMGGKTEMTFSQKGHLPSDEYATGLKEGWTGFFNKMEKVLDKK